MGCVCVGHLGGRSALAPSCVTVFVVASSTDCCYFVLYVLVCFSPSAALHRLMLHVQGSVVKNDWCRNSTFSPRVAPDFEGKRAATSLSVKFGLQINYRTETRDGDISF